MIYYERGFRIEFLLLFILLFIYCICVTMTVDLIIKFKPDTKSCVTLEHLEMKELFSLIIISQLIYYYYYF